MPDDATAVASLRSYVVLSFDAPSGRYGASADGPSRCAAAARIVPRLARDGYVFHPYPVTPYHPDFLEQSDLAADARARYAIVPAHAQSAADPLVRAHGTLAEALIPAEARSDAQRWDATLEEIDVDRLFAATAVGPIGEPPWAKNGWYQAYLLYAGQTAKAATSAALARTFDRLERGGYRDEVEKVNLERALVGELVRDCRRVVVGYTLRHEYFNSEYSLGIENVGFDSQRGFDSPLFPRTAKLKDFPWNGWLRIGVATAPAAAWNPIGGFGDAFGRTLWSAIADPALLPNPRGDGWIDNRAHVAAKGGPLAIPADASTVEPSTGQLRPAGPGKLAQARLRYSLVTSNFHDGTRGEIADLVYPYVVAFRWSNAQRSDAARFDPAVARAGARIRDWLAGFKVIGLKIQTRNYGDDMKFSYRVPVIDVYLNHRLDARGEAAAIAPPWSTLPWEVIALMEQAVERGIATFTAEEAQRRKLPWLDLARDQTVGVRLAALVEELRSQSYRPEALKRLVTAQEARNRWDALARFYAEHRHFLVTNGPYRLEAWNADGAVLQVFRDFSYPLGVGDFDAYAIPLRGYASRIEDRGESLELHAEVERIARSQRSYEIERVAYVPAKDHAEEDAPPECRYVIVGPGANVVRAGTARSDPTGRFVIDLKHLGAAGLYTVAAAVFVGGNTMEPKVSFVQHRVDGPGAQAPREAAARH